LEQVVGNLLDNALKYTPPGGRIDIAVTRERDEAEDGVRGLERLLTTRPEVALVDIGLPGRDGYDLARAVRGAPGGGQICLIALTGYGQAEDRRRAEKAGFDRHLVKPVDEQQLRAVLASLPRRV
jgi:CheY-like chemotaxis protein